MVLSDSKNIILEKVKKYNRKNIFLTETNTLNSKTFYKNNELPLDLLFKQEISKVSGNCIICNSKEELITGLKSLFDEYKLNSIFCIDKYLQTILTDSKIPFSDDKENFNDMEAGFTQCEFLISRLGSIMISSKQTSGRKMNIFPPTHIILSYTSQLVYDLDDAFSKIKQKYVNELPSLISVITGPSRTADIEKTLILGAHGPKQLFVFLVKDN